MSARAFISRALVTASLTVGLALSALACQVEEGPATPSGPTTAVKVANTEAPAQGAAPSPKPAAVEAPSQPAAGQPSACCGSGACGQKAEAQAQGADCPCRAAAKAAGLPAPSCGGGPS